MNGKNPELTVEAKVATKKNAGKGRTPKSPVWKVLDDARKKFNAQIVKSTSVKRECIKACIGKYYAPLYVDEKKLYANSSSNVQETPSEAPATSGSAVTAA